MSSVHYHNDSIAHNISPCYYYTYFRTYCRKTFLQVVKGKFMQKSIIPTILLLLLLLLLGGCSMSPTAHVTTTPTAKHCEYSYYSSYGGGIEIPIPCTRFRITHLKLGDDISPVVRVLNEAEEVLILGSTSLFIFNSRVERQQVKLLSRTTLLLSFLSVNQGTFIRFQT